MSQLVSMVRSFCSCDVRADIAEEEAVDDARAVLGDRHDARAVHAAGIDRQGEVRPAPQPQPAIDRAALLRRGHDDQGIAVGGLELREIDHRMEARMDAGDVVALDEIVGVVLPVAVHLELGLAHLGEGLDRIVLHRLRQAAERVRPAAARLHRSSQRPVRARSRPGSASGRALPCGTSPPRRNPARASGCRRCRTPSRDSGSAARRNGRAPSSSSCEARCGHTLWKPRRLPSRSRITKNR